jgi:hypothetical protein
MSTQRPPSLREQSEVQRLLRGLGQSTLSAHSTVDEQAREERMAARIEAQVEELSRRRVGSRRIGFAFLAAAAVVVLSLGGGLRYLDWGKSHLSIEQEPLATGKDPQIVPTSSAAQPQVPAQPQPRVLAPTARAGAASVPEPAVMPVPSAGSNEPQSTLAQENKLFKEAAEATRTGDVEGALTRLDRLLIDNPASPLAQTAQVRKFRLLAAAGRTEEARAEAERYLTLYPTGFAVSEAEAVKNGAKSARPPADSGAAEAP